MQGISLETWLQIAVLVVPVMLAIKKKERETREDRRKYLAQLREDDRKHQAKVRKILAGKLAEDDSLQESAR